VADVLPPELDFLKDDAATPERMNRAMAYLLSLYSTVAGLRPDYEAAIEQIQTIGLQRLTQVLQPMFVDAEQISAALIELRDNWLETNVLADLQALLEQEVQDVDDELRPRIGAAEAAIAAHDARLAALETERWFSNHGY